MSIAAPIPMQHVDPVREFPVTFVKPGERVVEVQPKLSEPPTAPPLTPPELSAPPLESLFPIDRLFITKRLRVKSVLFLRGKKNRFFVRTQDQKTVYTVEEENTWWVGYFCYGLRPLQLKVSNNNGEEIMRIDRPYAFTTRVLPCQLQKTHNLKMSKCVFFQWSHDFVDPHSAIPKPPAKRGNYGNPPLLSGCLLADSRITLKIETQLTVFAPPGNLLGTVEQKWTFVKPLYVVNNRDGDPVFWIFGPMMTVSCYNDVSFTIARPDGSPVGSSRKRWQGLTHALFFSPITDKFGVAFDMDLAMEEKGLLLAATLLLHYMYYDA